jgi:uncharacterized protein YbjT (DUF2867 family)
MTTDPDGRPRTVLVVGATGSVGRPAVREALRRGHRVRALVRHPQTARDLEPADLVAGDLTRAETLAAAVDGVDAVIFTHGSSVSKETVRAVDYGAVRNVLAALGGRRVRIALMSAVAVTNRQGRFNVELEAHDWKRRGERLVRLSGNEYTIVRPGWFDYNAPDERRIVMRQGDVRSACDPSDGVIARDQIARVLVACLGDDAAEHKTFELVAERGEEQADLTPLFAALDADAPRALDGVHDPVNLPLDGEPEHVLDDLRDLT